MVSGILAESGKHEATLPRGAISVMLGMTPQKHNCNLCAAAIAFFRLRVEFNRLCRMNYKLSIQSAHVHRADHLAQDTHKQATKL